MVVSSPRLELPSVCADKAPALLPLCNLSHPQNHATAQAATIYDHVAVTVVLAQ